MRLIEFLGDKLVFIFINIILFIIISSIMFFSEISGVEVFLIGCIWFLPCGAYIILDYIRYYRYINNLHVHMANLERKYLLPEVIDEGDSLIAQEINQVLKEVGRDMHENVNLYKNQQQEYKEYIEMWIHEIKTPIASARLLIENNQNEITRKVDTQLDRIENFVEQVLYYARSEDISKDYVIREVEIREIVNNVVKRNYRDFISKRILLKAENIEGKILCDSKWCEFILNQIITNSIKYSKRSSGEIEIYTKIIGDIISLSIKDNGVGISEVDIDRVFEKGYTGNNGRIFGKSTGIGLYLSKKLCKKLGIGIKLTSENGKGTTVTLYFNNKRLI